MIAKKWSCKHRKPFKQQGEGYMCPDCKLLITLTK